jgi:hypothetical protein
LARKNSIPSGLSAVLSRNGVIGVELCLVPASAPLAQEIAGRLNTLHQADDTIIANALNGLAIGGEHRSTIDQFPGVPLVFDFSVVQNPSPSTWKIAER